MPYFDGLYYRVAPLPCFEKQQILAPHTIGEVMFVCDFHTIEQVSTNAPDELTANETEGRDLEHFTEGLGGLQD